MGRHSASYIAAQQALSTGPTAAGAARYVGRVGGLALALGLGAAVAGGAGLAHADGTPDAKAGPTAGEGTPNGTPNDVDSSAKSKTRKPGLFNAPTMSLGGSGGALTGHVPEPGKLPGLISKIPQQIAGLVADRTTGSSEASTSPKGGRTPDVSSRAGSRHSAVFGQPGPAAGGDVTNIAKLSTTIADVETALHTGSPSLGAVPSTPDPTPQRLLNVSSYTATNPGPVTAFAGPAPGAAAPAGSIAAVASGLVASLGGSSSGSGGSPLAPGPVIAGALQLIRRETNAPSLVQTPIFTSISSLLHPTPAPAVPTQPNPPSTTTAPPMPGDVGPNTQYGSIGKWMIQSNGQVSNYGGQPYQGKTLVEPVNVIIVDPNSKSAAESTAKVNRDMILAGFPPQPVHTGGFKGLIGGKTYSQQPGGLINAYSDNLFVVQNDHGRLFGPAPLPDNNNNGKADDGYVYSGAFSTETPTIYNGLPAHAYVSSNMARDALVLRLLATGQVQSVSYIDMNNAINTGGTTTGDHDGYAVVIVLK